jgi:hypothetical protein
MSEQGTPEASEAEIAVHWQEEANVNPPEKFVVQANLTDNKVLERFSLRQLPGLLPRNTPISLTGIGPGTLRSNEQSAVLEMVRRRQNQR